MGVDKTSRRKTIKKTDGKYAVLFYTAKKNSVDMAGDTMEKVEKRLGKY